jgi:hypothetical protein
MMQIYIIKNKTGMTNFPNVMGKYTISKKSVIYSLFVMQF